MTAASLTESSISTSMAHELAGVRVLLVHHWLYTWAGAERVLEQLVEMMPHADVLAGFVTPDMRREHPIAARARESWVGKLPLARTKHRWFLPAHALAFATYDTRDYDLIISISHAFEKSIRPRKRGAVHVSYCLSPPRYLWDLSEEHVELAPLAQRLALRAARAPLRRLDRRSVAGVHRIVSLSAHVADRVWRAYGRRSAVVYPPVTRKPSRPRMSGRDDFLLCLGRLVPYKRVDLAILAAQRIGARLVVAGDGPERARLERLAGTETTFLGHISEERAGELLSTCAGLVFCGEEDFGITPVEAMAHGAPVIAYGRGGACETILDGITGVFFQQQDVGSVATAIAACLDRGWNEADLRAHAEHFAPENFRTGMRSEINAALAG